MDGATFEAALDSGRPAVLDVKVNRDTAVPLIGTWQFPPIVQAEPTFGERLVVTAGVPFDMPGTTNLLKVEAV